MEDNKESTTHEHVEAIEEEESIFELKEMLEIGKEIVDSDTCRVIAEGYVSRMNSKSEIEKERLKLQIEAADKNKSYFQFRYWQDIIMVTIILIAIGGLSYTEHLGQATVGTLVGTVIGYALGRFKDSIN